MGNAVHVEGHAGDVHVEDVVMPFLIADLRGAKGRVRARMSAFLSSRHNNDSDTTGYGDRITHNKHLSSQEESLFFFKVSNNKTSHPTTSYPKGPSQHCRL